MTINTRNKIILGGMFLTTLLVAGFITSMIILFNRASVEHETTAELISVAAELLYAVAAIVILYFSFRKTKSPEIFFFILFVISMCFDSLKAAFVLFNAMGIAPYYGVLLTRAVYFGRFLGTLAVLTSGLFPLGAEYQRMEIYIGVSFLLSFALSAAIPVDMTEIDPVMLFQMGHMRELGIISVIFLFFGVFNFILYAIQNSSKDHVYLAAGLALAIIGREINFYTQQPLLSAVAVVLLVAGTVLFGERAHAIHLWA